MTIKQIADRVLIAVFVAGTGGVAVASLVRTPNPAALARENRRPTSLSDVFGRTPTIKGVSAKFEQCFTDRLVGRSQILSWNAKIKVEQLGVSSSERVILGRDGWLFLDEEKSESSGRRSADEQVRLWHNAICKRRNWCAAHGVHYLLVLTPEKHSIYPEFLPSDLQHPRPPTPAERLAATLRDEGSVKVLDLRAALLRAKTEQLVYFRTDTHWNPDGGFVAYQLVAEVLGITPSGRDRLQITPTTHAGDLARMLCLPDFPLEACIDLAVAEPRSRPIQGTVPLGGLDRSPGHSQAVYRGTDGEHLRVVLFHDSFGPIVLIPALAEHCECLVTIPTASFESQAIESFHPQIVIQQIAERKINWHLPDRGSAASRVSY